jgi:hypothetical protein
LVAKKIWMQFKRDFTVAQRDFCLTNQTAQQSSFHRANTMVEEGRGETMHDTVDTITQLATYDRGTVATLTVTNAKLALQLETSQIYINTLKEEIGVLKAKI